VSAWSQMRPARAWRRVAAAGVAPLVLAAALALAMLGPLAAPHDPAESIGVPFSGPAAGSPLGTDFLGHDVFSRLLHGGRSLVLLSLAATVAAYAIGLPVGLVAGFRRGRVESLLMRCADIALALPAFVLISVLVVGAGRSVPSLIVSVALVTAPEIARVIRAATLEAATHDYVDAAVAGGERAWSVVAREIAPNLAPTILADLGVRLVTAAYLLATLNFLGLGLGAGAVDWAVMISENRSGLTDQPLAVAAPALMLLAITVSVNLTFDRARHAWRAA
jgi:ABC-type dipeptide/oligopeptide/nickel transport system permease subunit